MVPELMINMTGATKGSALHSIICPLFLSGSGMKILLTSELQMSLYLVNHSLYRETKRLGENKKPLRSPGDCLQGCRDLCSLIFHCNAISLLGSQSTSQTLMLRFTHGYYLAWVISRAEFRCRYQGRAGLESY